MVVQTKDTTQHSETQKSNLKLEFSSTCPWQKKRENSNWIPQMSKMRKIQIPQIL